MIRGGRLCIIPCGSRKIWDDNPTAGPTEAQYIYTGVFATTCQAYARTFFDNWVILSAKYGFLHPEDIIEESYNVSFIKPTEETISIKKLDQQATEKGLKNYQEIVVLGGKHYINYVKAVFAIDSNIVLPLSNCKGIGYMLQKLKYSIAQKLELENATIAQNIEEVKHSKKTRKTSFSLSDNSSKKTGKYVNLFTYLDRCNDTKVSVTFEEIEAIIGFKLPQSARTHRPWWANTLSHSHAKSWLLAGWEVSYINLPTKVVFIKTP